MAAGVEGVAAQDAAHAEVGALEPTVKAQALGRVVRARRMETALPPEKGREHELVAANQQQETAREQRRL